MTASLALLSPGQNGIITRIGGPRSLRVRLMELGLLPGTDIRVQRCAPLGDPMHVIVRGCSLSLRRADASGIQIRVVQTVSTPQARGRAA